MLASVASAGSPSGAELAHRLAREAAGAGLRSDLRALLEHQDLAPGLGEDLRRAESRRARAEDQVLDVFHASSSRRRAAASARAAAEWIGEHAQPAEQGASPAVEVRGHVAGREAGRAGQEEEVHVAHALAIRGDVDPLGPHDTLDRGHGGPEHRPQRGGLGRRELGQRLGVAAELHDQLSRIGLGAGVVGHLPPLVPVDHAPGGRDPAGHLRADAAALGRHGTPLLVGLRW